MAFGERTVKRALLECQEQKDSIEKHNSIAKVCTELYFRCNTRLKYFLRPRQNKSGARPAVSATKQRFLALLERSGHRQGRFVTWNRGKETNLNSGTTEAKG